MDFVSYLPAIILLILGFGLVVLEMYLPGFGAPGILGCILLVAGGIAARPTPLQALIMALVIIILLCIALSIFVHSASKGRLSNSRLVLKEVSTHPESENELSYFVGKTGTASTALRPAGMAEFDGVRLSVVSKGEFIEAGRAVTVECVEGNRIVVHEAKKA